MDTTQFVLSFAVFMVVATFMLTQWSYRPALQPLQRINCTFDNACRGGNCAGGGPADIVILPKAEDGAAYYHQAGQDTRRNALETVSAREWVARRGATGMMRLTLRENGAFTLTEADGFDAGAKVLATATGACVDAGQTVQEQG
jgi:hypothetical protein